MKFLLNKTILASLIGVLSFIIVPLTNSNFHVQAQETGQLTQAQMTTNQEPEIVDSSALRAEFKQYTQDPKSRVVRFEMILRSSIRSDRVTITWRVSGTSRLVDGFGTRVDLAVEPGKTYTIPIEVIPTGFGLSEVYGKAEAFQVDGSSIATVRKTYFVNESAEVLPITEEYSSRKTLALVTDVLTIVGIVLGLLIGGFIGFRIFVKWFKKDLIKEYDQQQVKK
jgi:hypothetical protein